MITKEFIQDLLARVEGAGLGHIEVHSLERLFDLQAIQLEQAPGDHTAEITLLRSVRDALAHAAAEGGAAGPDETELIALSNDLMLQIAQL